MIEVEIRHAHLFCGIGGGAAGFNRGSARVGPLRAKFRCLGGIDVDAACVADFEGMTGVRATRLDLFTRGQYVAFHGQEPPAGWCEAAPDDIRRAFGGERPHIAFLSAPCKGFSGLLSERMSRSDKYQALNCLTLRGVWLFLEAFESDPVDLILFENVPRIATRGRALLDHIVALLRAYGYAVAETRHDCGEIGGLAQRRERFLLVARHREKVPAFLYEPPKRPLRGVGEVLGRLPLPGLLDDAGLPLGGPMHRVPALQWKTWVRLAFVEAGKDWRSLNRLAVADGVLRDYGIAPEAGWHAGVLGVRGWDEPSGAIAGESLPTNGAFSVADPRVAGHPKSVQLGVRRWDQVGAVVTGKMIAGGGPHAVADPRIDGTIFSNQFRVVAWRDVSASIKGPGGAGNGLAVADPRAISTYEGSGKYRVTGFGEPAGTVIAGSTSGNGAFAVADPRPACLDGRRFYLTQNHYGVRRWSEPTGAVTASGQHDNGAWSVADPRGLPICTDSQTETNACLPAADERLVCMIRALDGTWHRPFTTLECAALQSLFDPHDDFDLHGSSDSAKRERIGNCVPRDAAAAIAGVCGRVLLGVWAGQASMLADEPVWVRPVAIAAAVDVPGAAE